MRFAARAPFLWIFFLLVSTPAFSRDLSQRMGLGVSNIGVGLLPHLAVNWHLSSASAVEVHTGFQSGDSNLFEIGTRLTRNLFIEDSQDFYMMLGLGLQSRQADGTNASGYAIEGGMGSRIFLPNLPNFTLNFGGGVALSSGGGLKLGTRVYFGMYYYF